VSDERDLTGVEELLRSVPAPSEVPTRYAEVAKEAAIGSDISGGLRSAARRTLPRRRWFAAAGVVVGALAATLVFAVADGGSSTSYQSSIALTAGSPSFAKATGSLEIGKADGAMSPAVLRVSDLPPAPAGEYYEMWFTSKDDTVGIMAFNTNADGTVKVDGAIPAGMHWDRCWVSLESDAGNGHTVVKPVLHSS
jgi:hypothetical protein